VGGIVDHKAAVDILDKDIIWYQVNQGAQEGVFFGQGLFGFYAPGNILPYSQDARNLPGLVGKGGIAPVYPHRAAIAAEVAGLAGDGLMGGGYCLPEHRLGLGRSAGAVSVSTMFWPKFRGGAAKKFLRKAVKEDNPTGSIHL
jgi:hypothetical protein